MGTSVSLNACPLQPLLPPRPAFEDDKYYHCTVDAYIDGSSKTGCDQEFLIRLFSCETGNWINTWLNNGWECTANAELVKWVEATAQRLVATAGPYDTIGECNAAN